MAVFNTPHVIGEVSPFLSLDLTTWANEHGHTITAGVIMLGNSPGVAVFNQNSDPKGNIVVSAELEPLSFTKDLEDQFKSLARTYGQPIIDTDYHVIQIIVSGLTRGARIKKLQEAAEAFPSILTNINAKQPIVCSHCNQDGADTYMLQDEIKLSPIHIACEPAIIARINDEIQQQIAQIKEESDDGNYLLATLTAVLGGVVGAIPAFIALFFFHYFVWVLFALIPLGAAFAYKMGNGRRNKFMPFIVSKLTLITTISLVFLDMYLTIHQMLVEYGILDELVEYGYLATAVLPFNYFIDLLMYSFESNPSYLLRDMGMALFAAVVGIGIAWNYMTRTNNKKIRELEAQLVATPTNGSGMI